MSRRDGGCPICFEPIVEGVHCECGSSFHHSCVQAYALSVAEEGLQMKCPSCVCEWPEEVYLPSLKDKLERFQRARQAQQDLLARRVEAPPSPGMLEALAPYGIRQCPQCHILIQKQAEGLFTGCDKMTCRCGCMFCFSCGLEARAGGVARCRCVGPQHSYIPRSAVLSNYEGASVIFPSVLDADLTKRQRGSSKQSAARLRRDAVLLGQDPPPHIRVPYQVGQPRWHFLMEGPDNTPFEGGILWGELDMPKDYPYNPPLVRFRTPNGRFKVDTWLCRTQMDYHPEGWQPTWTLGGFLLALLTLLCNDSFTSGMLPGSSDAEKRRLAAASRDFNLAHAEFPKELFS